jgi:phage FluMu gp28-like protein
MDANEILRAWLRGTFLRYQLKWILDDSLVASILKGRQLGLTDASAARCILGGFRDGRPQIVLSAAQANANLLLDAVRTHCRFLAKIGLPEAEDFAVDNSEEIRWRSGGSVIALAANPRTARSFHGDLTLDEFAYHQDAEGIWAAAAPMTTRGDWKVRVVSTPNGAQGLFYEWCKSPPKRSMTCNRRSLFGIRSTD